ncbi:hypothetical protein [Streptomyces sp. NPDC002962]
MTGVTGAPGSPGGADAVGVWLLVRRAAAMVGLLGADCAMSLST